MSTLSRARHAHDGSNRLSARLGPTDEATRKRLDAEWERRHWFEEQDRWQAAAYRRAVDAYHAAAGKRPEKRHSLTVKALAIRPKERPDKYGALRFEWVMRYEYQLRQGRNAQEAYDWLAEFYKVETDDPRGSVHQQLKRARKWLRANRPDLFDSILDDESLKLPNPR